MLLKINDKEYGVEYGMLAFERLEIEMEMSGTAIIERILLEQSKGIFVTINKLAYEAIRVWHKYNGTGLFDLTLLDFTRWMDRQPEGSPEVKYIIEEFTASWYQGKSVDDWIKEVVNIYAQLNNTDDSTANKVAKKKSTAARKSSKTATRGASTAKSTKG